MRPIDADALAKRMQYLIRMRVYDAFDCLNEIDAAPTIDAVPVIRCKDCKHWDFGDCYRQEMTRPDDFCSYGERRN